MLKESEFRFLITVFRLLKKKIKKIFFYLLEELFMNKYIKHFKTITKHRRIVRHYCFKCGQYKRGLLHDLSKYSPSEFWTSARYFQGTYSPIDAEKNEKGYSLAWQHHKGHNPHHWEYWIDNVGTRKNTPIKIPYPYLIEMLCDWIGAGKTYSKEKWTQEEPYNYYMKVKDSRIINPRSEKVIIYMLEIIRDEGLKKFCWLARHPKESKVLTNYINGE